MIDLKKPLQIYTEKRDRENKVGRYSCSSIYAFLQGWETPEDFIKGKQMDFAGQFNCWEGTYKHKAIEELMEILGYETEVKKEMKVGDFTIVGIADYLSKDEVSDLKTSRELYSKAKKWHEFQVKLYCTLFEKPVGKIMQPVFEEEYKPNKVGIPKPVPTNFYLKEIGSVKRDDSWFKKEMEKLSAFHKEVVKLKNK